MSPATIWDLEVPEVSMDELLKAAGDSKRKPRPQVLEAYHRAIEAAKGIIEPRLVWREATIEKSGAQEVWLAGGVKLTSKLLARVAGKADKLLVFAATIGPQLDEKGLALQQEGKSMEAFALDAAGTAFISKTSRVGLERIEALLGQESSFPMGPGHSYWPGLTDMPALADFVAAEQIGISLATSNLMLPRKSLAMVVGIGKNMAEFRKKSHCHFCDLQGSCHLSQAGKC